MTQELAPVRFAREFYELLERDAKPEIIDGTEYSVWRGKLTELYGELKITNKYYTPIRALLVQTASITILEAGARNRVSTVILNKPLPPPDELAPILAGLDLTGTRPAATIGEVEARLVALEVWRETTGGINIQEALRNIESRLVRLEALAKNGR
jgi:hypothetical protein